MATLLLLVIVFVYLSIIWIAVLAVYNVFLEPFDFGPLGSFALKSVALVSVVAIVIAVVPFGQYASLPVWWIGLMVIFKKDFWECKILVILIWFISFLMGMGIQFLLSSITRSPIATV